MYSLIERRPQRERQTTTQTQRKKRGQRELGKGDKRKGGTLDDYYDRDIQAKIKSSIQTAKLKVPEITTAPSSRQTTIFQHMVLEAEPAPEERQEAQGTGDSDDDNSD
eukprot:gene34553-44664_t